MPDAYVLYGQADDTLLQLEEGWQEMEVHTFPLCLML